MYVNARTQMFDCKRCGEYGSVYKILRALDKLYLLGGRAITPTDKISSLREQEAAMEGAETADDAADTVRSRIMPAGWKILLNGSSYLLSRGIRPEDCLRYEIGVTDLWRKYRNYVLFPVRDGGEIRGWVGRYADKEVPEGVLRYSNSPDTEFGKLLYGYDEIREGTETVIIVEGIFDKIAVDRLLCLTPDDKSGIRCVCTFGKKISEAQIRKLLRKEIRNVVLMYDFDAIKDTKKYSAELEKYFNTGITFTPRKDIAECTEAEAYEAFSRIMRPREFAVDVIGELKKR